MQAANWAGGLEQAYAGQVFVSPAIRAWVLAVSTRLPQANPQKPPDRLSPLLLRLSRRFGEAQYFATHRLVEYQAWAMARQGQIVRAYACLGESGQVLWNVGPQTPEETALGLKLSLEVSQATSYEGGGHRVSPNLPVEAAVLAVARRWSVDPTFPSGDYTPGIGVTGTFTG